MPTTPTLDEFIRGWVRKLERTYPRVGGCEVMVERPHQKQHQGQRFRVRITLAVPGHDVVVSHDPEDGAHENAYVAIRDAFRAARRQLEALSDELQSRAMP